MIQFRMKALLVIMKYIRVCVEENEFFRNEEFKGGKVHGKGNIQMKKVSTSQ